MGLIARVSLRRRSRSRMTEAEKAGPHSRVQFPALCRTSAIPTPAEVASTAAPMRKSRQPGPVDQTIRLTRHKAMTATNHGQRVFLEELFIVALSGLASRIR